MRYHRHAEWTIAKVAGALYIAASVGSFLLREMGWR